MAADWAKLHTEVLDTPKIMSLDADAFRTWALLIAVAKRAGAEGELPPIANIAFVLRISKKQIAADLKTLIEAGLVEETESGYRMHDWSDWQPKDETSTDRVRKWRNRKQPKDLGETEEQTQQNETLHETNETVKRLQQNETLHETETAQSRVEEIRGDKIRGDKNTHPQTPAIPKTQNAECVSDKKQNPLSADVPYFRSPEVNGQTGAVLKRLGEINAEAKRTPNISPAAKDRDKLSDAIGQFGSKRVENLWHWAVNSPHRRAKFLRNGGFLTVKSIFDPEKVGEYIELSEQLDAWAAEIREGPSQSDDDEAAIQAALKSIGATK